MFIKLILLVIGILSVAILAMGINVFFRKKKFPDSSVGGNKELRKRGLRCARGEEIKCRREIDGLKSTSACDSCGCVS